MILGVSPDTVEDVAKFIKKFNLPFTLLADTDHEISDLYGVWADKKLFGREYKGIIRTTFILDEEGRIKSVFERVNPKGHSKEVLEKLMG